MTHLRQHIAIGLLLLFAAFTTPKEVWHAFQTHTDAQHTLGDGLSIETAHHHCTLLKADQLLHALTPPVFIQAPKPPVIYWSLDFLGFDLARPIQKAIDKDKNRGPPAC